MWQLLGGADNVTATLVALAVLVGLVRALLRRTVFRRRELRRRVNRLAIGVNEAYVLDALGSPTYGSVVDGSGWLAWTLDYLNASVTLSSGRVESFSVTLIDPLFRLDPEPLTFSALTGPLGAVTFAAAAGVPSGQNFQLGARRLTYSESHYKGNPGGYLTYVLGYSDSSTVGDPGLPARGAPSNYVATGEYATSTGQSPTMGTNDGTSEGLTPDEAAFLATIRQSGRPNTFSVLGMGVSPASHDWSGAVDLDLFRLLPPRRDLWHRLESRSLGLLRRT